MPKKLKIFCLVYRHYEIVGSSIIIIFYMFTLYNKEHFVMKTNYYLCDPHVKHKANKNGYNADNCSFHSKWFK